MKKTYIQPSMAELKLEVANVIASSMTFGGTTEQNLSRHHNDIWDDEEEDL